VTVRYLELKGDVSLLSFAGKESTRLKESSGMSRREWGVERRTVITFRNTRDLAESPDLPNRPVIGRMPAGEPVFYPHAVLADASAKHLKQARKIHHEGRLVTTPPPVSLADARAACGVGPYTYFPSQSAWAIEGKGVTYLIGAKGKGVYPGSLVSVIDDITTRGAATIVLARQSAREPKPARYYYLQKKGFDSGFSVRSRALEHSEIIYEVQVKPSGVLNLVRALDEQGLQVNGRRIEKTDTARPFPPSPSG